MASGVTGDSLVGRHPALRPDTTVLSNGNEIPLTQSDVAKAFPEASARVAGFLHGWSVNESCWAWRPPTRGEQVPDPETTLGYDVRLRRDLGYTTVYVRYNTGLHVSDNGRQLTDVLGTLTGPWSTELAALALLGHSMSGLVARSACHHAEESAHGWLSKIGAVMCLGSPHLGATLEKGAHVLGWVLGQFPETEALGGLVNARRAGVKSLSFGAVTSDHWSVRDAEEVLADRVAGSGAVGRQEVCLLSARLAAGDSPMAGVLGDVVVPVSGASGQGAQRAVPIMQDGLVRITGVSHLGLLNSPLVNEVPRRWLGLPGGGEADTDTPDRP